jgi:hypothetical protein
VYARRVRAAGRDGGERSEGERRRRTHTRDRSSAEPARHDESPARAAVEPDRDHAPYGASATTCSRCAIGGTCDRCRGSAATAGTRTVSEPSDAGERVAHAAADAFTRGGAAPSPAGRGHGGRKLRPELDRRISAAQGRGHTLDDDLRARFQPAFGDLGAVRIHTDETAHGFARALGASAFTVGRDIYFGRGTYRPGTPDGDRLLAHELAHAVHHGDDDRRVHRDVVGSLRCHGTAMLPGNPDRAGTWEHVVIQQYYVSTINPNAEAEYLIPESGPNGGDSAADLVDPYGGGIYEIKFIGVLDQAPSKVWRSIEKAREHCDPDVPWHAGTQYWAPPLPFPGGQLLISWLDSPGVIGYRLMSPPLPVPIKDPVDVPIPVPVRSPAHAREPDRVASDDPYGPFAIPTLASAALAAAAHFAETYGTQVARQLASTFTLRTMATTTGEIIAVGSGGGAAGGGAGLAASGARASRLFGLGSRAGIIGVAVAGTLFVADMLSRYAYGTIYWGTRGARLQEQYLRLGLAAERLALTSDAADAMIDTMMEVGDEDSAENAELRAYFFEILWQLRVRIFEMATEITDAVQEFSALEDELDHSDDFDVQLALETADMLIDGGYRDYSSLLIMHSSLAHALRWVENQLGRMVDNHEAVFKRDGSNWLKRRR